MTSTEIATRETTRGTTRGALTLAPDQTDWTPQQLAALRQLGIEDASEGDLLVFRHVCQSTGLDPFRKQIYMIGRKTKVKYWDDRQRKQVEDWVMKWTIQTGIDGFRRNGHAAAKREGNAIRVDGPYWQGDDGKGWQDVWLSDKPPAAAKFTIFRDGEPHTGIAMYREFVQTAPGSDAPNSMWKKMPANQLAKCAEAQGWRRAYPDDFSAVQLEDAAQIIDPDGAAAQPTRARSERVSAAELMSGGRAADIVEDASDPVAKPDNVQVEEATPAAGEEPRASADQIKALGTALKLWNKRTRKQQLDYLTEQFKREITDPAQLSEWECTALTEHLVESKRKADEDDNAAAPDGEQLVDGEQLPMDGENGGTQ